MKKLLLSSVFILALCLQTNAQVSLTGRVYYCSNMLKEEMQQAKKDFNKDIQNEKGATAEEKKEANKMVQAMMDALVSTMTVKFLNNKELDLSIAVKCDDEKAKAGGVPWAIRKIMKLKLKSKSVNGKAPYTFDGKNVKLSNPKTKKEMILQLTADGKAMIWKHDDLTVRLTRTK